MTMKKIVASLAALALTVSTMATVVSAEPNVTNDNLSVENTVTVTTNIPEIKVTVPTTTAVIINPYKLSVADPASNDSVISVAQGISNESNCAIDLSVTASAKAEGKAVIATSALKGTEKTNSVFLFIEAAATEEALKGTYDSKSANQMALTTKETTKSILTLAADSGAGVVKISGDAASAPTTPWTASDKATVTLKYNIVPVAAEETTTD